MFMLLANADPNLNTEHNTEMLSPYTFACKLFLIQTLKMQSNKSIYLKICFRPILKYKLTMHSSSCIWISTKSWGNYPLFSC